MAYTYRNGDPGPSTLSYLIISGGTGANAIASAFGESPAFVLPVSDDGGSSSEILRCFGGPSIGDIRSRLIRLIPIPDHAPRTRDEEERLAIYNLMAYRFPSDVPEKVGRDLWMEIVEGRSSLWDGIGEDKKECIRAFLVHFQTLSLRRAHKRFSFRNFSLGNGFLTGARDLFGSLPSAIFLFKSIAGVNPSAQVIPVINTNQTVTIAAALQDGLTLVGQCAISHPVAVPISSSPGVGTPSVPIGTSNGDGLQHEAVVTTDRWRLNGSSGLSLGTSTPAQPGTPIRTSRAGTPLRTHFRRDSRTFDLEIMSPSEPASRTSLEKPLSNRVDTPLEEEPRGGNIGYRKGVGEVPLEAPIERIFYINLYGQEIYPEPNPDFLQALANRDILVYSCGSLYTSIIPCLALRGLAAAIATSPTLRARVLLLNTENDRETPDYTATDHVVAILAALQRYDKPRMDTSLRTVARWEPIRLVTHVVYLEGGDLALDVSGFTDMGIQLIEVPHNVHGFQAGSTPLFTPHSVEWAMQRVMRGLSSDLCHP